MHERPRHAAAGRAHGFSLIELMITVLLLGVIVVTLTTVMSLATRSKTATTHSIEATEAGRVAMDMIARDLRSAGYGADRDYVATPQPLIAYVDSLELLINENLEPYPDTTATGPGTPQAYAPTGTGRPRPLDGTAWTPPIKYRTGAEIVRWTLDLNNDGVVDVTDQADVNGVDANRTPNPDDYELVRQVYGDSTNNTLGFNGPVTQRVALVRRPGSGIAPLFTVYLKGSTTAWDWSNGPVPAAQLGDIERVAVDITSPSGKRDWRGHYAESRFKTEVSSVRNVPQSPADEYLVEGYVFFDSIPNQARDLGERGLPGATMRFGAFTSVTSATGYFSFSAEPGIYTLEQVIPPPGYVNARSPLTASITVPPATTEWFPATERPGGHVTVFVFNDLDGDGLQDMGEVGKSGARIVLEPEGTSAFTDATGYTPSPMFAPVGTCSLTVTPPDSFVTTTTNPVVLEVSDGDALSATFGVRMLAPGTISGRVFSDTDRDGVVDAGETGIQNVWVGVTTDGMTALAQAWTDADGLFSMSVPGNDPPGTIPYSVMIVPPAGFYPTSPTSINGLLLSAGEVIGGNNFGLSSFTIITLAANRVLSLGSADLVEKDWDGTRVDSRHGDADIVLGSDVGGSDQVSVWFNRYAASPLFLETPNYTRSAPGAVLSMALGHLKTDSPVERADLVTGCRVATAGNFFLWFCQNSSGNEGYFPSTYSRAYKTADQGDVQAVLALDCAGGVTADRLDVLVGTKAPTAFTGALEVWANDNAANPSLSRTEIYPPMGGLAAGTLGEVNALALGDFDADGLQDVVIGTRCATGGQVCIMKNMGKSSSPHFYVQKTVSIAGEAVTALAVMDANGDGRMDVLAGTWTSADGGRIHLLSAGGSGFDFKVMRTAEAAGIVTALAATDMGGGSSSDLVVGYRVGTTGYVGGVAIYYFDGGTLPSLGVDPSGGALTNWVSALTAGNLNYGINPAAAAPYLPDVAAGAKIAADTGAIVLFIR